MDELGGGRSDDRGATRPGPDASLSELLGHAIGRHITSVRTIGGLALMIASVAMLGLFVWGAVVPFHSERTTSSLGEVCVTNGATLTTLGCYEVDEDRLDQAFEDDINHSNRVIGVLGATTSCAALVLGWRTWRGPWRRRKPVGRRARSVIAAVCLSPLAAIAIFVAVTGLYWWYSSLFE